MKQSALWGFVENLRALLDANMDDEVLAEVRGDYCKRLLAATKRKLKKDHR
jgi:hypothetical protein